MRIALGTVQFGQNYGIANKSGQVSIDVAKSMLEIAYANGIDTLDTAIAYGESERCLGSIGVNGMKVVTKLPGLSVDCPSVESWIRDQAENALARLRVPAVHGLLLHRSEDLRGARGGEVYKALCGLKRDGLVRKIGISVYSPTELDELLSIFDFDIVQAPLNLVDRRIASSGWLRKLSLAGVEVHTRSAFLQGLLLMPESVIPSKFSPWKPKWKLWHEWLFASGMSALEACLAYSMSFKEIDKVIVGADGSNQFLEIISAASRLKVMEDFPDLASEDERLIVPANWAML